MLIVACPFKSGQNNPEWPHLNPEEAEQIAKEANAKKQALLHFDANIYMILEIREYAQESARKIFNNAVAAHDSTLMEI